MKSKITAVTTIVLVLLLTSAALLCGVWFFRAAWYGEAELSSEEQSETSKVVRERVNRARAIQRERFVEDGILTNGDMGEKHIKKYCKLSLECEQILQNAYQTLKLSPRARSRIIKVARTIADMSNSLQIRPEHILEAVSYPRY
jgi:magnesium chelatase family protein